MKEFNIILVLIHSHAVLSWSETIRNAEWIRDINEPLAVPAEMGEYFEGDMVLTEKQKMALFPSKYNRNGLMDVAKLWPDNTLVYFFTQNEFTTKERRLIRAAMWDIENSSCVRFRQRRNNEYAVRITNSSAGCSSNVGYINDDQWRPREQTVSLAEGCFEPGTIRHEFLHALGFYHMQSTYNRDDYIRIVWRNIQEEMEGNFMKYDNMTVSNFGVEYDYGSVMHYPSTAFSKNGLRTIITLQPGVTIGQRAGMSRGDIIRLNRMYNCNNQIAMG